MSAMDFDTILNSFRGYHTLVMIAIFIGICWWAFSKPRKKLNDEAANMIFEDDEIDRRTQEKVAEKKR